MEKYLNLLYNLFIVDDRYMLLVNGLIFTLGVTFVAAVIGIILGMLFNDITYSLYLILFFVPIRTLLGGYHAKTPYTCFIFFNSLFIAVYYFTHLVSPSVLKDISLLLILISLTLYYKDHSKYKIILTLIVSVFIIIELLDLVPSLYISSAFFMSSFLYLINFPFQYFSCSRHNMI